MTLIGSNYTLVSIRKSTDYPDWAPDTCSGSRGHPQWTSNHTYIKRCKWWRAIDTFTSLVWTKDRSFTLSWNWRWSIRPTYGDDSALRQRATKQALLLQQFWYRWKHEYLTSIREFHKNTGTNKRTIKNWDVVLVHGESPRSTWKLAVVGDLIKGGDGLVRAANIHTSTEWSNRPITKLYPLEVCTNEATPPTEDNTSEQTIMVPTPSQNRPRRTKVLEAMRRIADWARNIRAPRRM